MGLRESFEWSEVRTAISWNRFSTILGRAFFLIYINDLSINIAPTIKFVEDYISIFSIIHDARKTTLELKKDIQKTVDWTYQ